MPRVDVGAVVECGEYPSVTAGKLGYAAAAAELCLEVGDMPCEEAGE